MSTGQDAISTAKARRNRLQAAVNDLDNRIASIKRDQQDRDLGDRVAMEREVRQLNDQRNTALELLSAADDQYVQKRNAHDDATAATVKDLGKIGNACTAAARRFDKALSDAMAALEEIEREAARLEWTVIPNAIRSHYTHARCINGAIAVAFESRLSRSVAPSERLSMTQRIAGMISDARDFASQHKKDAA